MSINDIRIAPPGLLPWDGGTLGGDMHYLPADLMEITDEEWDEIWLGYEQESIGQGFSKYLRELILLARGIKCE